ncbi:hypothetical protein RRF57_001259 [Xylaria bambusicola]|uniref:Lysozyme n=1 Tax=Xylaria bambusicola TaxID=326684 RepID=A0AAN7UBL1_9PEZI
MIKATEGTTYLDPKFSSHYTGATNAGLIRGGYHFAHLDASSGATRRTTSFLTEVDGPVMVSPSPGCLISRAAVCSRLVPLLLGSRTLAIPTTPRQVWWSSCTGNSNAFVNTNPLVLARYSSSAGTPPGGWPYYTFWQYNDAYSFGGDSEVFNGDMAGLLRIARG